MLNDSRALLASLLVLVAGVLSACAPGATGQEAGQDAAAQPSAASGEGKPLVLATFTVLADMAQVVGGEHVQVESLTKAGAEIHGYEPTPSDVRKAADADLILANGLNLEAWLEQFVQDAAAPAITVTEGITPLSIVEGEGEGYPNPHAWMSPVAAQTYVDNIASALADLDPAHADSYRANAEAYKQELSQVHQELISAISNLPQHQRLLVTCEGAFSYLAADAGLDEAYLWAVNSDGETGARRMMELSDKVAGSAVPAVFCESTVPTRTMEQIATDTGATYAGALYVDSLSDADGPVPTYLDLIRYDTRLMAEALSQ
ncbi:metal ABC transporter substrate-binding protein [Rothia nasimurium]|uniref:metal ABC transporter substrate-binding protein n=1 Tax=Rothia nasimurium TaxID=85336 RepID=UPI001F47BD69|nr:metal ABC transporter substrate-binding protein [Rothia nasimurium]